MDSLSTYTSFDMAEESLDNVMNEICDNEEFREFCKEWKHIPTESLNSQYIYWSKMKNRKAIKEAVRLVREDLCENVNYCNSCNITSVKCRSCRVLDRRIGEGLV